jgi:hypothetical protein
MANPFKRLDVLIIDLFGFGTREISRKLDQLQKSVDQLQTDINLIKSVLLVEDTQAENISISLGPPADKP